MLLEAANKDILVLVLETLRLLAVDINGIKVRSFALVGSGDAPGRS